MRVPNVWRRSLKRIERTPARLSVRLNAAALNGLLQ
jgi:hypothetical protein